MNSTRLAAALAIFVLSCTAASADGPRDNDVNDVRRVPRLGIEVAPSDRAELEAGLDRLEQAIDRLAKSESARVHALLPDVEVYYRAVRDALVHREFFDVKEVDRARRQLLSGLARATALASGEAAWTEETGLVVRGYRSRIDGSAQPYGLVIPASYTRDRNAQFRLDVWFHGRGETLSEVNFIDQRERQEGTFAPPDAIVLHPYGRYSNAFKFAGETDVLEAIESVRARYRIDPERIAMRGFSMGGAACWQFAVHYADRWFAANPGAGFAETPEFLRTFQNETLAPTWYERKLWRLYDCTDWAPNLVHCPTVAYSGEIDRQKQAADIMAAALAKEGIDLVHVIGPKTGHSYHPEARAEVAARLASLAERGRERFPPRVTLVTYTLKYNRMHWVTVDALEAHWERARVDAGLVSDHEVIVNTENVAALTLEFPPGWCPLEQRIPVQISIDGQSLSVPAPRSDRSWHCALRKNGEAWTRSDEPLTGLRKRHDLQGPIDDAFMDSFIFVRPTRRARSPLVEDWARAELDRAVEHWRRHFRGDARVVDDRDVSDEDIASSNLVLWGDPAANRVLERIAERLPIRWTADDGVRVGERSYADGHHALIAIYPSPLNPERYVVLNSGFTFREYAYLNNARQVPMLPDWAVVDVRQPPSSRWPGRIVDAGFFGERWELLPPKEPDPAE